MSQPVIRVEGLGKRYRIGEGARHTALRNLIGDALRAPVRLLVGSKDGSKDGAKAVIGANNVSNRGANGRGSRFI